MSDNSPSSADLIGTWAPAPDDVRACEVYGDVILTFEPTGTLIYTIVQDDVLQKILLSYRVEGDQLITNQPSAPREERAQFTITSGQLWMKSEGIVSRWIRQGWSPITEL
jgi:hypothetical protein